MSASRIDRIVSVGMEGIVLVTVMVMPWMCPGQCAWPTFLTGSAVPAPLTSIGSPLVFSAIVIALLLLWTLRLLARWRFDWKHCPVILCLAALFLLGVWQLTPLSDRVLATVAPATAQLYEQLSPDNRQVEIAEQGDGLASSTPGRTISMEPEATRDQLIRLLQVLLVFAMVRTSVASPAAFRRLCIAATANGVLLALFAITRHYSGGSTTLLYKMFFARNGVFGPFLNRNLFPLYVNICIGLGLGLLAVTLNQMRVARAGRSRHQRPAESDAETAGGSGSLLSHPVVLWISFAVAVMLCGVTVSQSRGGLVVLLLALAVCVVIRLRTLGWRQLAGGEAIIFTAAMSLVLLGWVGFEWKKSKFSTLEKEETYTTEGRLRLWASVWPLAREFPVWGTGYGTFYNVEPIRRTVLPKPEQRDAYAMNDYLEGLIEGGVVRLALHVLILLLVFRFGYRACRRHDPVVSGLALGSIFGLCAFAFHSFIEPGLGHAPIVYFATVVAAYLCALGDPIAGPEAKGLPDQAAHSHGGLSPAFAAVVAVGLAFLLLAYGMRSERYEQAVLNYIGFDQAKADVHRQLQPSLRVAATVFPEKPELQLELGRNYCIVFEDEVRKLHDRRALLGLVDLFQAAAVPALSTNTSFVKAITDSAARERVRAGADVAVTQTLVQQHIVPALQHYVRARDLCPLLVKAHFGIAYTLDKAGGGYALTPYLDRAKYLRPADPRIWFQCGLLEQSHGEPVQIWAGSWKRSLELGNCHFADIIELADRWLRPEQILASVLPDRPELIYTAATQLAMQHPQGMETRPYFAKALRLLDERSARSLEHNWQLRAKLCRRLGMTGEAHTAFETALAKNPLHDSLRLDYAGFLFDQGHYEEARKETLKVMARDAKDARIRELLTNIDSAVSASEVAAKLFEHTSHDLGSAPRGAVLTHRFHLKNPYSYTLRLHRLRTSCGCADADAERIEVPPGEATDVQVRIDTAKYAGPRVFTVYVQFDNVAAKEAQLRLWADSREDVTLEPAELTLGQGYGTHASTTVVYRGSFDWRVNGVDADGNLLKAGLHEVERTPGRVVYRLDLDLAAAAPPGARDTQVWLATNDPSSPRVKIPVTVKVESALVARPSKLDLRPAEPGSLTHQGRVIIYGPKPFQIQDVQGTDARWQVKFTAGDRKTVHYLQVFFAADPKFTDVSRQFKVVTDLPKEGSVEFTAEAKVEP